MRDNMEREAKEKRQLKEVYGVQGAYRGHSASAGFCFVLKHRQL